jgi:hypothetical protein
MKPIPTAYDLAIQMSNQKGYRPDEEPILFAAKLAREFAKLHCEAQQKTICEKVRMEELYIDDETTIEIIDRKSIRTAYPLENIK